MDDLFNWINPKTNKHSPMISPEIHTIIMNNADVRTKNLFNFKLNAFSDCNKMQLQLLKNKTVYFQLKNFPWTSSEIKNLMILWNVILSN